MSELLLPNNPQIVEAKRTLAGYDDFIELNWENKPVRYSDFKRIKEEIGAIGIGAETIVLPHPGDETKVDGISMFPLTARRAKLIFRYHSILSTLFPHNFPHIYASFGAPDCVDNEKAITECNTGTIRQKITGRPLRHYSYDYKTHSMTDRIVTKSKRLKRRELDVKHPFSKAMETIYKLGADPVIDNHNGNFLVSADGGEYYLDTVKTMVSDFDPQKTGTYMSSHNFSQGSIERVMFSLDRIKSIKEDAGPDQRNFVEAIKLMIEQPYMLG